MLSIGCLSTQWHLLLAKQMSVLLIDILDRAALVPLFLLCRDPGKVPVRSASLGS